MTNDTADAPATVVLRQPALIQRIADRTDLRPNQIKPVLEAALMELGLAIDRGESLNLAGFGKLTVARTRESGAARIAMLKLRRKAGIDADSAPDNAAPPLRNPKQRAKKPATEG